jgi:hypothetical protein
VALQFNCPKCGQKLTLTSSKPGDWLDCPNCEAAVEVHGAAPPKLTPPRTAAPTRPAALPVPEAPNFLATEPREQKPNLWADKRVQFGALAGGVAVILIALFALALVFQQPKAPPEQAHNNPQPTEQPAPPTPSTPPTTPPAPAKPKDDTPPLTRSRDAAPRVPKDDPSKPVTRPPDYSRLDQFGNPLDQNSGLARQGELKGQRLLFWSPHTGASDLFFAPKNPLWKALEDKGFVVRREFGRFDAKWLKEIDQLWILSTAPENILELARKTVPDLAAAKRELKNRVAMGDAIVKEVTRGLPKGWTVDDAIEMQFGDLAQSVSPTFRLTEEDYDAIEAFAKSGKGLCLLADNDPFTYEANELAKRLFGASVQGNYQGTRIAYVKNGQLTPELIKKYGGDYEVDPHPLLTGVNFVYEGITISKPSASDKLDVALKASDGNPVVAVSKAPGLRVVIDCGFTRYCHGPSDRVSFIRMTAGTTRLAQNIAAYLAGKTEAKKE